MTDYKNVYTKKRTFVVRAKLPNLSATSVFFYTADDTLIDRNGDFIIDRNDDSIVIRNSFYGRPRSINIKKRNFVVRAQVG